MLGKKVYQGGIKRLYGLGVKTYSGMHTLGQKTADVMSAISPYVPGAKLPAMVLQSTLNSVDAIARPMHRGIKAVANSIEKL